MNQHGIFKTINKNMSNIDFNEAKIWYVRIYLQSKKERATYFLLFLILILNISIVYEIFNIIISKEKKISIVININKPKLHLTKINKLPKKGAKNEILRYIISQFILTKESLIHEYESNFLDQKLHRLSNTSSKSLLSEFKNEIYSSDNGSDFSYLIRNGQKFAKVNKIILLDKNGNSIEDGFFNKYIFSKHPYGAKIFFSIEDDLSDLSKYFQVEIRYRIVFPNNKNGNIDFKVISYNKTEIFEES